MFVEASLVLEMMLAAESHPERSPWRSTYPATAAAIAAAANANPLFKGPRGPEETAAEIVSVAWFESHFEQRASGDRECLERDAKKECTKRGEPRSWCAMQVHDSNFAGMKVTRDELLDDIGKCVSTGLRLMHESYRTCAGRPHEERLNQYATGGPLCVTPLHDEGGHRVRKGVWLLKNTKRP